jgi:hypothetical protein
MDMTLISPPPLLSAGVYLFVAIVWIGPIGLFVLRRHLANATGLRLAAKTVLAGLTVLTAPAAALMVLIITAGAAEAVGLVWSLLRNTW